MREVKSKTVIEMDLLSDMEPTLKILDKIVAFEEKMEYNRLLLFICLAGFITIIGGWIEYVCYQFLSVDSTFFIFGLGAADEPVLFVGLWLIYLIPLIGVLIFTTGISPGFINWNKAYRTIGALIIGLFGVTHVLILVIGISNSQFIPIIWGVTVCVGFLLTGRVLFLEMKNKELQLGLFSFGLFAFILGVISSVIVYPLAAELGMFLFCNILGFILIVISMITYWNMARTDEKSKETL